MWLENYELDELVLDLKKEGINVVIEDAKDSLDQTLCCNSSWSSGQGGWGWCGGGSWWGCRSNNPQNYKRD